MITNTASFWFCCTWKRRMSSHMRIRAFVICKLSLNHKSAIAQLQQLLVEVDDVAGSGQILKGKRGGFIYPPIFDVWDKT